MFGQIWDTLLHSYAWHGLPLSHGLRTIEGFTDDVGMARMLSGFGDDVEQCASCGAGRSGLEPGGGWERVAGVEVWEVEHELIGTIGDGLVTVEERREGVPVTHLELGGTRCRVPRCTEGVRSVAYELDPCGLGGAVVFDDAPDAQGADGWGGRGLCVREALRSLAQEAAVGVQRFEKIGAFCGRRWHRTSLRAVRADGAGEGSWHVLQRVSVRLC